jgi:thiol:disulfide interchange protein DsbD
MGERCWVIFFVVALVVSAALSGVGYGGNEVRFRADAGIQPVSPGGQMQIQLRAIIAPGWHLYSLTPYPKEVLLAPQPTSITIKENSGFRLSGDPKQPRPEFSRDENFGIETTYFEGLVDFEVPVQVDQQLQTGLYEVPLEVRFMACNDRLCLPPETVLIPVSVQVDRDVQELVANLDQSVEVAQEGKAVEMGGVGGGSSESAVVDPQNLGMMQSSLLAYILFAMVGGWLALLTPCVFPMIPITVSYFTKRGATRKRAISEALLYAFGIVLTFTFLGFLLTALWGAGGINRLATSPLINLVIAGVFLVFALSLFGIVELRLPSSWLSAVGKKSSSTGGPLGILLMALTFSLTSFTCTVPFVGTVMVAATKGNWLWSLLGVTVFATVFAAPFFFLAMFPSWLMSLPKSGSWMNSMKVTMGFLELAAAVKFISNVDMVYQWELLTRPVFITVWMAIVVAFVVYLLGGISFLHDRQRQRIGMFRWGGIGGCLILLIYLFKGISGGSLGELNAFLPPRDYGSDERILDFAEVDPSLGTRESKFWFTDYSEALTEAGKTEKSIFVDFTGYTCTNCRWMESNIFTRPKVRDLLGRYLLVRLYTDGGKAQHKANLEMERKRFGTIAIPLYALMNAKDEIIAQFAGLTRDEDEFIHFLQLGLAPRSP